MSVAAGGKGFPADGPAAMIQHFAQSFRIAIEAIAHNKLRAVLTSLGIVFGVGSVISMLAVGTGAKQEILEQMKLLGTNNIIITPIVEQEEGKVADDELAKKTEKRRFSPGLTLSDGEGILRTIPGVEFVSPEVLVETMVSREGLKRTSKLVGVDSIYFATTDFELERGHLFSRMNMDLASPVAVIGQAIKTRFFPMEDPIGGRIKCGQALVDGHRSAERTEGQQGEHPASRASRLQLRCLRSGEHDPPPVQEPDAGDKA